jgi:hypothetical protein
MRKVLYVVALLALGWVVCFPPRVTALPSQEQYTYYFSSPDFETQVGEEALYCNHGHSLHGKRTPYVIIETMSCDIPPQFPPLQECLACEAIDSLGRLQHCLSVACPQDPFLN